MKSGGGGAVAVVVIGISLIVATHKHIKRLEEHKDV